jgi:hypothetical protein
MTLTDLPPLTADQLAVIAADLGTACLGTYPATATDDAYQCQELLVCHLCDGVLCADHDEVVDCGDGPAHNDCHRKGCASVACAQDRADDALLERDD